MGVGGGTGPRGVLSMEKGTNCGLTTGEWWLSRRLKEGGCAYIIL